MAAQSQPIGAGASTITYPNVARAFSARKDFFERETNPIKFFAQASIKAHGVPNLDEIKHSENLARTRAYLDLLEFDTNMSPELNGQTDIEGVLKLITNRPKVYFPDDVKQRAAMLLQRFEGENWGAGNEQAEDGDSGPDDDEEVASPIVATAPAAPAAEPAGATVTIRLPPADNRIWAPGGIMHGIVFNQTIHRFVLDTRRQSRPSAKAYGHNGLAVGAWWPYRICALKDGAHGASQAGVSGNAQQGAHSIVVAGAYEDVDKDDGEKIWYSAPGSEKNKDRNEAPSSAGRGYLQASFNTRRSVRVLRSATKKQSTYAPSVGIRYDGLYEVVRQETDHNSKGGLFFKYLLKRLPGQKPLMDVINNSPTAQQMADYRRIEDRW